MRERKTMHFPPAIIDTPPPDRLLNEPITYYEAKDSGPDGIDLSFVCLLKTNSNNIRLWANMKLVLKSTSLRKPAPPGRRHLGSRVMYRRLGLLILPALRVYPRIHPN